MKTTSFKSLRAQLRASARHAAELLADPAEVLAQHIQYYVRDLEEELEAKEETQEREGLCKECSKDIKHCECLQAASTEELGTKASGFADGGPFTCMNCIHRTPHSIVDNEILDSCQHPEVMKDPELKDRLLPDGKIRVDYDECCRYVRPKGK